jgi:hypothetical protein
VNPRSDPQQPAERDEVRSRGSPVSGRGADLAVDVLGREHVLDDHRRRPDHARAGAEPAHAQPQVPRRHRQRAADRGLAHAREKLLRRLGELAAEDDKTSCVQQTEVQG